MTYTIKPHLKWVGKIDWELKHFHGEELSTHRGSSYNSYLITDEKTILIDTVWQPFAKEFIANLKKEIDLKSIDAIVCLHGEVDHSGSLAELLREIPDTPIYCTANAVKSLKGQYHADWNFKTVKSGDSLDLGRRKLQFIEAPMLHWPDSMFAFLSGDNILFSNDAFGQHYASELLYNDLVDQAELYQEALKYYANILTPFSRQVQTKLQEVATSGLTIDMICPSHGILWRDKPGQIIEAYAKWSNEYAEPQVTIIYDTMWHATSHMAAAIAGGIREANPALAVKLFQMGKADESDAMTEVFRSRAILFGSPTVNRNVLPSLASIANRIKSAGLKGKKGASFGSYGWSGESVKLLNTYLEDAGIALLHEGMRFTWDPDADALAQCHQMGLSIGHALEEA